MTRSALVQLFIACGVVAALCPSLILLAEEPQASQLLPNTTVAYLEIAQPVTILNTVLDHPLSQRVQAMDVYKKAQMSEGFRGFLTGRKFFELQIGADWRPAIDALTARGIYAGYDAATQGAVLLVRGKDEATMENFRAKILEMTRLSGGEKGEPVEYRELLIYRLEKGGAAVVRDWLIVTNKSELGKSVVDRLLDSGEGNASQDDAATLAGNTDFLAAQKTRGMEADAWGFVNLNAVREAGGAKKLFEGKAENPLAELLIGGIQSTLRHSPYLTADLEVASGGVKLQFSTPWQSDWIPEERAYYFGPDSDGSAPSLPEVPGTLVTLSTYRDISQMWLRAGDLFDEQTNDQLAEADSNLSTVFAGRDFGEEILGSLEPQIGLMVVRQSFENKTPVPAIKLPAFALVMKLRDPETMRSELRRTFQSAIGFFNIVGAQQGNPQLEMDMQKNGDVDMITSRYLPEKKDKDSTSAPIIFNFSPSVGFVGDRFILSSTAELAQQLAEAPSTETRQAGVNTSLKLLVPAISESLADNREQLISQNMLEEGHSREEAEAAIGLLFEIVRCFKGAWMNLERVDQQLSLGLSLEVNE
ncbi:MAG: hypothetical protein DWI00_10805 [Planctomycetota bacterium]|nr:MAG: hypothetical protein DWI00_10805 [Planctomycetota bacterium]